MSTFTKTELYRLEANAYAWFGVDDFAVWWRRAATKSPSAFFSREPTILVESGCGAVAVGFA
jgi:hypothetical protein